MRSSVPTAAFLMLVLSIPAVADSTIRWQMTLDGAKKTAAQSNQLVLVHFWAPYCSACRRMDAEVFGDPAVAEVINAYYVPVKVNTEYFPATANQFGITSLPTDVILSPQGQVLQRMGFTKAPDYTARLNQVVASFRATSNTPPVYAQMPGAAPGAGVLPSSQMSSTPPATAGMMPGGTMPPASYAPNAGAPGAYAAGNYAANAAQIPAARTSPLPSPMVMPQPVTNQPTAPSSMAGAYGAGVPNPYGQPPSSGMPGATLGAGTANAGNLAMANAGRAGLPNGVGAPGMPGSTGASPGLSLNPTMPTATPSANLANQPFPASSQQQLAMNSRPGPWSGMSGSVPGVGTASTPAAPLGSSTGPGAGFATALGSNSRPAVNPAPQNNTATLPNNPADRAAPVGFASVASAASATSATSPAVPPGNPPLGLDGFCPVSLVERQTWVPGDRRWGVIHHGRTYLFASPEAQQRFFANPETFAPAMSGIDIVMALEQGATVPGQRQHGVYYDNKIYLFSTEETLRRFEKNPDYYAKAALQALKPMSYTSYR